VKLGRILVARSTKGVCAILIGVNDGELEADLAARFPGARRIANHRVVRKDGDLAGYHWRMDRKRALVRREAAA
jgi:hypothetical protein